MNLLQCMVLKVKHIRGQCPHPYPHPQLLVNRLGRAGATVPSQNPHLSSALQMWMSVFGAWHGCACHPTQGSSFVFTECNELSHCRAGFPEREYGMEGPMSLGFLGGQTYSWASVHTCYLLWGHKTVSSSLLTQGNTLYCLRSVLDKE